MVFKVMGPIFRVKIGNKKDEIRIAFVLILVLSVDPTDTWRPAIDFLFNFF